MSKHYDETIEIDFIVPNYIKKTIKDLIKEREKQSLHIDFYEMDLISECNQAYNDGLLTLEQVKILRAKYL